MLFLFQYLLNFQGAEALFQVRSLSYLLVVLLGKYKIRCILGLLVNGIIFISPYIVHKYEEAYSISSGATGLDSAPFMSFAMSFVLSIAYTIGSVVVFIILEILKKRDR